MSQNVQEIAHQNGFDFFQYDVHTDDGYILEIHRIREYSTPEGAPAVLMLHGFGECSDSWLMNDPLKSPAMVLARAGYDVWLGNSRGNRYSRRHKDLDPDSSDKEERKKFFAFSWVDMGEHDLPAMIDFVRFHTGQNKITYVGFS